MPRAVGCARACRAVMMLVNAVDANREFIVPALAKGVKWRLFVDTGADTPKDIYPHLDGPQLPTSHKVQLKARSLCCFVAEHETPVNSPGPSIPTNTP